jgi:hypothetical protein
MQTLLSLSLPTILVLGVAVVKYVWDRLARAPLHY